MTVMYRKTECQGCGYVQETFLSYYLDAKMWKTNHTLTACRERKMSVACASVQIVRKDKDERTKRTRGSDCGRVFQKV